MAEKLDLGYDLFDAIMNAREIQAKNVAIAIKEQADNYLLRVYIHGKAYKPDVAYLEGSYSLLIGHYLEQMGITPFYIDPLTESVVPTSVKGVVLLAHNRKITYGYAGEENEQELYCEIEGGSVIIDPWRQYSSTRTDIKVIHYGNSRKV
jgi:UDPglucose 6-dehydrogenase